MSSHRGPTPFESMLPLLISLGSVIAAPRVGAAPPASPAAAGVPTLDQIVALKRVSSPTISPNGRRVAYTVRDTDWVGNAFVTQIWVADVESGETRPITQGPKSNNAPAWSPDGRMLAFASERTEKRQVFRLDMTGGDALQVTSAEEGVTRFAWSPDGKSIAYVTTDPKSRAMKEREKRDGELLMVGEDQRMNHLWVIDVESKQARRVTTGPFSVGSFDWAPDGTRIAFDHQTNAELGADSTADISVVTVSDGTVRPLVTQTGPDTGPVWSPDGTRIAFQTTMATRWFYYANTEIAAVPAEGGAIEPLSGDFDEDCALIDWGPAGIFFSASQRTWSFLHLLDPATRRVTRLVPGEEWIGSGFSFDQAFTTTAFVASDATHYPEVFVSLLARPVPRPLTTMGAQLAGWRLGRSELMRWTSRDGASIEGVLHKPPGYRAGRRAPLVVVIHGGPTGVSRPTLFSSTYVYPIDLWLAKGALVLEPNYRGSAGYGAEFRALNVRNLGVGDTWDVVSGIDDLVRRGLVDSTHVGVCGWSQGGYISAFLATHESHRFRAISVGAGISDWTTYYVNTDITPFTRQYLHATPWDDPEIYARTSPITTVREARAPTLIQHGDNDARVPTPNAYELYRGLKDAGVTTRLAVFKGFGHGINKPKAVRAALRQNLEWFDRFLWGEGEATRLVGSPRGTTRGATARAPEPASVRPTSGTRP